MSIPITLTLTIGRRPDLLAQTLKSCLSSISFSHIIAINDFGDEPTNLVFRQLCPDGMLISHPSPTGHHAAIDRLYCEVKTPYVFHCEDDWLFDSIPDVQGAIDLLSRDQALTSVCFRQVRDFGLTAEQLSQVTNVTSGTATYHRLDGLHEQWHGYTFNPHLIATDTLLDIGSFSRFKKERHVSRWLRKQGRHVAYIEPGNCHHIGMDCSVSVRPSFGQRLLEHFNRWARRD